MEIKIGELALTMEQELRAYSREALEKINTEGDKIAKAGVKSLREASPKRTGRYAKGWTATSERRHGKPTQYVLHNKDRPWLVHLLEHGHATRDGGRTQGIPHVTPVEKEVTEAYLVAVEEALRDG